MGVINLTPDSFSDGGLYVKKENALSQVDYYINNGVSVIDLGAQSTRPGAKYVDYKEEIRRLLPALKEIRTTYPKVLISIDTFSSNVARMALEIGADWINDVSGGREDDEMLPLIGQAGCPYILMHSRGNSQNMNSFALYEDVVNDVLEELQLGTKLCFRKGITKDQLIWDLGLGFAKTTEQNLILLKHLEKFCSYGFPLLVGPSRKRFIGDVLNITEPKDRLFGNAAVVCRCVQAKVSLVRVHDVKEISQTIKMASNLWD